MTSHFIFANNGTFFWDVGLEIANETGPSDALPMGVDLIFKGTYVVDGRRFSLNVEFLNVGVTPEDLPGGDALEKEVKADFDWVLEGDVVKLRADYPARILYPGEIEDEVLGA